MRRQRRWPVGRQTSVAVSEEGGVRYLHIGGDAIQSAMRLSAPDHLELHYNRAMMGFLLFRPDPRAVLMVGLGGGSMARFLHRSYPRCKVTAIELNPDVVAAARRHFDLPADGPRFTTVLDDGAAWVAAHPDTADVLLLDAFDDGRQVPALCSEAFYRIAYAALPENGVLVQNFMSDDDPVDIYAERIEQAFGRPPTLLAAADRVNTILFAFREGPQRISWSVLEKRAKSLQDQFGLPGNHYLASLRRLNKPVGGTTGSKNGNDSDDKFFAF
jgi:spermidine synthase